MATIIIIIIIIIIRIFTQDSPSVHCTVINGVLRIELNLGVNFDNINILITLFS